ncbi:hypothetical protein [Pararhodospirillum oryzae]|uniref:Uncharacterized protein n=1 Tax=Pararhodospirillum oryzae TaxID=478448 RepID=A0A512H3T9_9PROT|nr:hypothetical protein [Pararhodospirillum oryzae]GEO80132.1 hypothetical protein ROR02_02630 [Pararhodospirillum oryzae]
MFAMKSVVFGLGVIVPLALIAGSAHAEMDYRCLTACINVAKGTHGGCQRRCSFQGTEAAGSQGETVISLQRRVLGTVQVEGVPLTLAPSVAVGATTAVTRPTNGYLQTHRVLLAPIPVDVAPELVEGGTPTVDLTETSMEDRIRSWAPSTGARAPSRIPTVSRVNYTCLSSCVKSGYQYQNCRAQCTPPETWSAPAPRKDARTVDRFPFLVGFGQ